jgi:hypothetical protein
LAAAKDLANADVTITTVCQANAAVLPRLKDGGTAVQFEASGRGVVSVGPNLPQAQAKVVEGKFGSPSVTLKVETPRGEPAVEIYAAAHMQSGNPPSGDVKYAIDVSLDGGQSWRPVVENWRITRRGDEPGDFWSQSFCWGSAPIDQENVKSVLVRFSNGGGKNVARAEAHLVYRASGRDATRVTFAWDDDGGQHRQSHLFPASEHESAWNLATGNDVQTRWVEFETVK